MYFNIAVHSEANPTHAVLAVDLSNAYNEDIMKALWEFPTTRPLWNNCYNILPPPKAASELVIPT